MTDRNKFEEMLERLVNEDKEGAEALFHEIVVEKSRDIYESLLEDEEVEETTDEEVDEATDEEVDESDEDLDEATDEEVDESDEDLDEATDDEVDEGMFPEGGDPADELGMDIEMPSADDGDMDMDMDMGDEEEGEEEEGEEEEEMESAFEEAEEMVREYTEKAPAPVTGEEGSVNKASVGEPKRPATDAKAVMSSGEESGSSTPTSTTQSDAADTRGATMSKA